MRISLLLVFDDGSAAVPFEPNFLFGSLSPNVKRVQRVASSFLISPANATITGDLATTPSKYSFTSLRSRPFTVSAVPSLSLLYGWPRGYIRAESSLIPRRVVSSSLSLMSVSRPSLSFHILWSKTGPREDIRYNFQDPFGPLACHPCLKDNAVLGVAE